MKFGLTTLCCTAAVLAAGVSSCVKGDIVAPSCVEVADRAQCRIPLLLSVSDDAVRSSIGSDAFLNKWEGEVKNITIIQCEGDNVWMTYYYDRPGSRVEILALKGRSYELYAVANRGDLRGSFPEGSASSAVAGMRDTVSSIRDFAVKGMPMSGRISIPESGAVSDLKLVLQRDLAKVNFRITNTVSSKRFVLEHGTFVVSNLRLRQANRYPQVFAESMAEAGTTVDGDDASSFDNISTINSGLVAPFYTTSNMCGNLLPEGAAMFERIPSNIGRYAGIATYIEFSGNYIDASGALSAETTMRLYLGKSARDFSAAGNDVIDLSVTLSDRHGYLESTWRLEPVVTDNRTLSFVDSSLALAKGMTYKVDLLCNGTKASQSSAMYNAFGLTYRLSDNLKEAGVSFDASTRTFSMTSQPQADVTGTLVATSWDGRISATLAVTAKRGADIGGDDSGETGGGTLDY